MQPWANWIDSLKDAPICCVLWRRGGQCIHDDGPPAYMTIGVPTTYNDDSITLVSFFGEDPAAMGVRVSIPWGSMISCKRLAFPSQDLIDWTSDGVQMGDLLSDKHTQALEGPLEDDTWHDS